MLPNARTDRQPVKTHGRRKVPPIVAAVVKPVANRLSRMEDLLIEMRHEQDVQLKRMTAVQRRVDALTEYVSVNLRRIARRK
jgi:hypothetical protein